MAIFNAEYVPELEWITIEVKNEFIVLLKLITILYVTARIIVITLNSIKL